MRQIRITEESKRYFEILVVIALLLGFLIFKFIPEYKNTQGSSDKYLDTKNIEDMVEVKIDNTTNFLLITKKSKINTILFFDKSSLCLYNQNIENMTIVDGVSTIVELLIENNSLTASSTIYFLKYSDDSEKSVEDAFTKKLSSMNIYPNYQEITTSLELRAKDFKIEATDSEQILKQLELESKEIVRYNKNNVSSNTHQEITTLTEETAKTYMNNVYKKIENYISTNNIVNQEVSASTLPITLIPASTSGNIFPDNTSWYYVRDSKVYAYISITNNSTTYSYCYIGTIDDYKKGQC